MAHARVREVAILDGVLCSERTLLALPPHSSIRGHSVTAPARLVEFLPLDCVQLPDELASRGVSSEIVSAFVRGGSWEAFRETRYPVTHVFCLDTPTGYFNCSSTIDFIWEAIRLYFGSYARMDRRFNFQSDKFSGVSYRNQRWYGSLDLELRPDDVEALGTFTELLMSFHSVSTGNADTRIALRILDRAQTYEIPEEDRVLYLVIALEALLSLGLTEYRKKKLVSRRTGWLVGSSTDDRMDIEEIVKACYDIRDAVAHGVASNFPVDMIVNKPSILLQFGSQALTDAFSKIVREAFVRRCVLEAKGFGNREDIIAALDGAAGGINVDLDLEGSYVQTRHGLTDATIRTYEEKQKAFWAVDGSKHPPRRWYVEPLTQESESSSARR